MATVKLFPYDITNDFLNNILNLSAINIIYGDKITKQFKNLLDTAVISLDTQQKILNTVTDILESPTTDEKTTAELNEQVKNVTVNIANEDTIEDIKRKYGDYNARWLPSDSDNPSITHEEFYFKIFKVSKGLYDKNYGAYVIAGERPNCKCGMEILNEE